MTVLENFGLQARELRLRAPPLLARPQLAGRPALDVGEPRCHAPAGSGNRVLVNQLPPQVRLLLRGAPAKLDDLHADDLGVQAVLTSTSDRFLRLDPSLVHAPPGVRVEAIDPSSIELVWEDVITRDVPIQVGVVGSPARASW